MSRTTRTVSCAILVALASAPVLGVAAPAVAAVASTAPAPADAGGQPVSEDFTAGVRSIDHFLGVVTLVGTAPVGTSVELAGDVVEPVSTEADATGRWTGQVGVRHGQHSIRVTSMVSGQVVHVPVEVLLLQDPWMAVQVDGYARTIHLDLTGQPRARMDVSVDGTLVDQVRTDDDGKAAIVLRDVAFGTRHIAVEQYFDGTRNGADEGDFLVSGAPVVTTSSASRETERIHLGGRAPAGASVGFSIGGTPVTGPDGAPITVTASDDTTWAATLPIPDGARTATVSVTATDGGDELGTVDADVVIPAALTAAVALLDDGRLRFTGGGEPGATVTLESTDGAPLSDATGASLQTTIDDGWELTVPRDVLPTDVLVARQRVSGVEQGGVRLLLPALPVRPAPGSGAGVSTGNHAPDQRPAAAKLSAPTTGRLAYTGAEPAGAVGAAALLLLAGAGTAAAARRLRHRGTLRTTTLHTTTPRTTTGPVRGA